MSIKKFAISLAIITSAIGCRARPEAARVLDAQDAGAAFTQADFNSLQTFMTKYCVDCHGDGGEANFTFADDLPKLASSPIVKKGNANASKMWQRLAAKTMPPSDADTFPSEDEKQVVRRWIDAGLPLTFGSATGGRKLVFARDTLKAMADDLAALPAGDRKFIRYLTLTNLYNQRSQDVPLIKDDQMFAFRNGLSFLVNSLHWRREITPLTSVAGAEGTVLRLDLRRYFSTAAEIAAIGVKGLAPTSDSWDYSQGYGLTPKAWDILVSNDPYKIAFEGQNSKFIQEQTGVQFPFMRGDIFTFLASRSHNAKKAETFKFAYYQILGIGGNFEDANRAIFGSTITDQLKAGNTTVIRSGFPDSGVSDHNRLIERHAIPTYQTPGGKEATYWLSYDFGGSVGNQHLESHPLGPVTAFGNINGGKHVYSHDGGEVIFSLPNGLHAYMLFTSAGVLLDEGPINIVRDKKRIVVLNGLSCMDCHRMGMLAKADKIREAIDQNSAQFTDEELKILSRYYRADQVTLNTQFTYDTNSYLTAKAKTVVDVGQFQSADKYNEAIQFGIPDLHDLFVSDVTPGVAASEVDLTEADFKSRVNANADLKQILASFITDGVVVKRETFRDFFPKIVASLNLAKVTDAVEGPALCAGCKVTCAAQVFTPQGGVLTATTFAAESVQSEGDARAAALQKCSEHLTDGLKAAGFTCKVPNACVQQGP